MRWIALREMAMKVLLCGSGNKSSFAGRGVDVYTSDMCRFHISRGFWQGEISTKKQLVGRFARSDE